MRLIETLQIPQSVNLTKGVLSPCGFSPLPNMSYYQNPAAAIFIGVTPEEYHRLAAFGRGVLGGYLQFDPGCLCRKVRLCCGRRGHHWRIVSPLALSCSFSRASLSETLL